MPTPFLRRVSAALALFTTLFFPAALHAQSATGVIEGRVFNAATRSALVNAHVSVDGTKLETLSDDYGNFHLAGVPAGEAHLRVTYVGLEAQSASVAVAAGSASQRDFDLRLSRASDSSARAEVVALSTFTVIGDRETSAQALSQNERKNAANIRQVVAFDEYGDRNAENIGELLRFLPGVVVIDGGQTASTLALRGFPDSNTSLQLDGAEMASARGNSRSQSLLDVPMANISRIEVNKVPTPDQPASGLGGSVNIISKNGFEARAPVFNYSVYLITDSYTGLTFDGGPRGPTDRLSPKHQQPSFDFSYLVPLKKKFALRFGGSRSWRLKPMETGDKSTDTQVDWNFLGGFARLSTWLSLANIVESMSGQIGADWKISDRDVLNISVTDRYVSNNIMRLTFAPTYGAGATGDRTFTQGAATAVGSIAQAAGTNRETGADTAHLTLKYAHRGDDWQLEALGALSRSRSFLADVDNGEFDAATATLSGLIIRGEGAGESSANIPVRYSATTAAKVPVDIFNGGNYVLGNPTSSQNRVITDKRTAKVDFTRSFATPLPFKLKTGLFVDQQVRDQKSFIKAWTFTPNGLTTSAAKLASNFDVFDTAFNATAPTVFGNKVNWISIPKFYNLYKAHPDWFVVNDATTFTSLVANSRKLAETISAGYVRGDVRLFNNKLLVAGGVRFEQTKDDGAGQLDDPTAQYQKDAAGNLIDGNATTAGVQPVLLTTDALARAHLRFKERGSRVIKTYSDLYPSLNFTYSLTENLFLRAAYSETISRPNLNNITPGSTIADPTAANLAITVNNTALKPWTARGYDLSIESYEYKGGYGSVGVFEKDIKDFFNSVTTHATPELLAQYGLPTDPLYANYDITTLTNGGNAKITGFEFEYHQRFDPFLPNWARGFQFVLNATRLHLSGGTQADFSSFLPSNYAGSLGFVRPRFEVKLNFTLQGATRLTAVAASAANGIPNGIFNYQAKRLRVGINARYSLTKRFSLYGSMTDINDPGFNLTNEQYGVGTPDFEHKRRRQALGSVITIGLKGEL